MDNEHITDALIVPHIAAGARGREVPQLAVGRLAFLTHPRVGGQGVSAPDCHTRSLHY